MRWAGGLLAATLSAELLLNGARMAAVSSTAGLAFIAEIFGTQWCRLWVARCAGLAVLLRLPVGGRPSAVLAAFWLSLRSAQGHPGAHGLFPAAIDWVHLLAAVSWIGSLFQLAMIRGPTPPRIAARVRRLATISVAALVPAGLYGAVLHIPSLDRLVNSPYGRTLLVKLSLAAVLLALGAANHFRYVPVLLRHGDSAANQRLRRVVRWEVVIAALVILMSALLGVLPMPHGMP